MTARRWRIIYWLRILVLAGGAVLVLLVTLDRPHGFWTSRAHLTYFIAAVAVIALAAAAPELLNRFSDIGLQRRMEVEEVLKAGLVRLSQVTGIEPWHIGTHAYRVVRPIMRLRNKELRKVALFRLGATHLAGGVRWTIGKGVIGTSWQQENFAAYDATDDVARAMSDPAAWDAQPAPARMSMSSVEMGAARHYGTIAALPVIDPRRNAIIGVVSVDGPSGALEALGSTQVELALNDLQLGVRRALER